MSEPTREGVAAYESAQRIIADDGDWTKGDAEACARFVVGATEEFRRRVAEARAARGEDAPSYSDLAEEAERDSREEGYRFD